MSSLFVLAACSSGLDESAPKSSKGGAGGSSAGSGGGGSGGATTGTGGTTTGTGGATTGSGGTTTGTGGATTGTGGATTGTGGATTGTGGAAGASDAGSKGGAAGTAGSSGAAGKGGTGGATDAGTPPPPPTDGGPSTIPTPTGMCPDFVQGDVTFHPTGGDRKVAISIGSKTGGALVLYWYATGSNPTETSRGLPMSTVLAAGGVVAAPYDVDNAGTFPWISNAALHETLADEIVGCAAQKGIINTARIHAVGFSAGALMTTQLSYARSSYLASVATYSGGGDGKFQEANNKFAAMIMTGGTGDIVVQNFYTSSQQYQTTLKGAGHFAMFCDHGGGHMIPSKLVPGVWQFFVDHPYGTNPSPYAGKIPAGINPPCIE